MDQSEGSIVTACSACGKPNRIVRSRLHDHPICGHCKQEIFPRKPLKVTDATWKTVVDESPIPVLVDFWAPWCGPCRAVAPVLDAIAAERAGRVKIAKLNVDENPASASRFDVHAIPTMILFRGPSQVDQLRGAVPKAAIQALLDRAT